MELKKYKLGELIDVRRGASLAGEYYATEGKLMRLTLGNFDYQGGGFKDNTSKNDLYFTGPVKPEFILSEGDIITPLTEQTPGLLGSTAVIPESGKYIQSQDVALVTPDESKLDRNFCYYLLPSKIVKQQLAAGAQQTKIRHTTADRIKDLTVFIPDLANQKAIGLLLHDIDRKIALNREINRNLEAMARQLYDYWFVQFNFPDENGKPYKSSGGNMVWNDRLKREIPQGWNVDNILSICEIKVGGTPSKFNNTYWDNGSIPFLGPTDVSDNIFQLDTVDHITHEGLEHCASSLFQVGDIILTARGSIGKMVIVGEPMAMNQSCYALSPKFQNTTYLYFLSKELIEWLKAKGSGSVFKSFNVQDVEYSQLCIAPTQIIERFCNSVNCLFSQIRENTKEIATLIAQREELLPLLMNGQVSVMPREVNCDLSHD